MEESNRSCSLTLVILAAGLGSRFGGDKSFASVGPQGQSLFEYSVFDAVRAGFNHILFVVNRDVKTNELAHRLDYLGQRIKIEFVVQALDSYAPLEFKNNNRKKPWGTAHALLVCQQNIRNPFAVINADDFYGASNFALIADYLENNSDDPNTGAMPGYLLANTLSHAGGVNRGICSVDQKGLLNTITEITNITYNASSGYSNDARPGDGGVDKDTDVALHHDSLVSMTFWGFQPSIFETLNSSFGAFLSESANSLTDEFYLPAVVDKAIHNGQLQMRVLPTSTKWMGLTYAEDLALVRDSVAELTKAEAYPNSFEC